MMTLRIRPVKLKQSIYLRVPSDIANLIGMDSEAEVTLTIEEQNHQFLLVYSVRKPLQQEPARSSPSEHVFRARETEQLAPVVSDQRVVRLEDE
jgi:hypothetical protein